MSINERQPRPLSQRERKRLQRFKENVLPQITPEDRIPSGLPAIPDTLRQQLLEFLNLDGDANAKWEHAQQTGEVYYHPVALAAQMVQDEFGTLMTNCEPQVIPIRDWINSEFRVNLDVINSAAMGAGLVIKAYHLMYGEGLIKSIKEIVPRDIMEGLSTETRSAENRFSLISVAARSYHLPAYQYNLNFCLSALGMCAPNYQAVMDGGTAIFRVLNRHADKIIPPVIS